MMLSNFILHNLHMKMYGNFILDILIYIFH